jgi:hypothetical protein
MRRILLLVLLIVLSASPAAAQSCATLGSPAGCDTLPKRPSANSPATPRAEPKTEMHGSGETTVSNHGASTTLNNSVIDSHGMVEFGFRGSTKTPCRVPGYGSACD